MGCPSYQDGLGGGMVSGLPPVLVFGSSEVAARVGAEVLSGRKQIALAISEPFAGSDVANIRSTRPSISLLRSIPPYRSSS